MKITIKSKEANFSIPIPNWLISEHLVAWGLKQGQKYSPQLQDIPTESIKILIHELKRSIKTFGHFELVHVESSDGDIVIIEV